MKRLITLCVCAGLLFGSSYTVAADNFSSDQIKAVQQALNEAGYNCGTVDGLAGRKTKEAIKAFEKDHALTEDGVIDQVFLNALGVSFFRHAEPEGLVWRNVTLGIQYEAQKGSAFFDTDEILEYNEVDDDFLSVTDMDSWMDEHWWTEMFVNVRRRFTTLNLKVTNLPVDEEDEDAFLADNMDSYLDRTMDGNVYEELDNLGILDPTVEGTQVSICGKNVPAVKAKWSAGGLDHYFLIADFFVNRRWVNIRVAGLDLEDLDGILDGFSLVDVEDISEQTMLKYVEAGNGVYRNDSIGLSMELRDDWQFDERNELLPHGVADNKEFAWDDLDSMLKNYQYVFLLNGITKDYRKSLSVMAEDMSVYDEAEKQKKMDRMFRYSNIQNVKAEEKTIEISGRQMRTRFTTGYDGEEPVWYDVGFLYFIHDCAITVDLAVYNDDYESMQALLDAIRLSDDVKGTAG